MALLTTCPACTTRFKVVPDQLRLHHGLVRCGACDHVFDANTRLVALVDAPSADASEALAQANESVESSPEAWYNKPAVQAMVDAGNAANSKTRANVFPSKGVMSSQNAGSEVTLSRRTNESNKHEALAQFDSSERYQAIDAEDLTAQAASQQAASQQAERRKRRTEKKRQQIQTKTDSQAMLELEDKVKPLGSDQFQAIQKKQRKPIDWSSSIRSRDASDSHGTASHRLKRFIAVFLMMLAAFAAVAQLLLLGRYALADSVPVTKPLLVQLCDYVGCKIEPANWLQPLSLDALTLTKPSASGSPIANAVAGGGALQTYKLQATVRNSSSLFIKKPDIELTISNAQGSVIARKTLSANTLAVSAAANATTTANATTNVANIKPQFEKAIEPITDWLIDAVLLLDDQTVGYTARLVYLP